MESSKNVANLTLCQAAKEFNWSTVSLLHSLELLVGKDQINSETNRIELKIDPQNPHLHWREARRRVQKELLARADEFQIKHLLSYLDTDFAVHGHYCRRQQHRAGLIKRLMVMGFTKIDCDALPLRTVTVKALRNVPKEHLLERDASLLGSLSSFSLEKLREQWDSKKGWCRNDKPRLKIRDVLQLKPEAWHGKGVAKAIQLLRRIGFTDADGPFLKRDSDPRRTLIEKLIVEEKISRKLACKIAEVAAKRNWI